MHHINARIFLVAIQNNLRHANMTEATSKAENGTRTHDPFITSEVLYQLSYFSGLGYYICSWEILQL